VDIRLIDIAKRFGDTGALQGISLEIASGELVALLGPSGSGKTTLLRVIAGLDVPTAGRVLFANEDATGVPVQRRRIGFVFQHYALFRHMSVFANVAYGLRVQRRAERPEKDAIRKRVMDLLDLVQLAGLEDRYPGQLSGGQRQRVALARALVNRPKVLLLDEPLGALDLKLRREMQIELKQMQRELGITFVFVTHDQEEALTMSDRIAVFREGRIEQVGTPVEIYEEPATPFVAGFVGTSNLLEGAVAQALVGDPGPVSIRPEKITLHPGHVTAADREGLCVATGVVGEVVYLGASTHWVVDLDGGGRLTVLQQLGSTPTASRGRRGEPVTLSWQRAHVIRLGTRPDLAPATDRQLIEETP
jgi:putative spermidine/putrescine transport system ATP-binding protein